MTLFLKKDVSNNIYITSGKIGIGLTNPATNYKLDVSGNINCGEIYRNGTPISSTLSLFLPLTGGTLTGLLTGTTISATNMTANLFSGSGASLTNINASNVSSGVLSITRGGIGTTTLSSNQLLIGNSTTSILQSPNLTWDNTTNTLSSSSITTNFLNCVDSNIPSALNARNLNLIGDAAVMRIWRNNTTNNSSLEFISGPTTSTTSYTWYWDMYIVVFVCFHQFLFYLLIYLLNHQLNYQFLILAA